MATVVYPPDPYRGWSNVNPMSNYPASRIMLDTSMQWRLVRNLGFYRMYQSTQSPYY